MLGMIYNIIGYHKCHVKLYWSKSKYSIILSYFISPTLLLYTKYCKFEYIITKHVLSMYTTKKVENAMKGFDLQYGNLLS